MNNMFHSLVAPLMSYRIVEIKDEGTPLVPTVQNIYYEDALLGMIIAAILMMVAAYLIICSRYRNRIRQLSENEKVGWKLWILRRRMTELEYQKAESLIEDMKKAAENYSMI